MLLQWLPCSLTKLGSFISRACGNNHLVKMRFTSSHDTNPRSYLGIGSTEYAAIGTFSTASENQTLTILDARKVSPGSFSETGFTLIKLDKVGLWTDIQSISNISSQEPETKNWRIWSKDLHLFREQMNPYLKKKYRVGKDRREATGMPQPPTTLLKP